MYRAARRTGPVADPDWTLGRWGSPAVLALALLAMVLMAVGSLLEIQPSWVAVAAMPWVLAIGWYVVGNGVVRLARRGA
jgi:hypothetical protein